MPTTHQVNSWLHRRIYIMYTRDETHKFRTMTRHNNKIRVWFVRSAFLLAKIFCKSSMSGWLHAELQMKKSYRHKNTYSQYPNRKKGLSRIFKFAQGGFSFYIVWYNDFYFIFTVRKSGFPQIESCVIDCYFKFNVAPRTGRLANFRCVIWFVDFTKIKKKYTLKNSEGARGARPWHHLILIKSFDKPTPVTW